MAEKTWTWVDKTRWGDGAWSDEPDKVQWTDQETGLVCLAKRNHHIGHWCGYVGVTEGHPYFGKSYSECAAEQSCGEEGWHCGHNPEAVLEVHGGITYSDFCEAGDPEHGICHVAEPGQPEKVFWLGFDCAHSQDLGPGSKGYGIAGYPQTYKDLAYVKSECADLAKQLAAIK